MIELDKKIEKEILAYCKINNIADVNMFFNKKTREWLNIEIYGDMNEKINKTPPQPPNSVASPEEPKETVKAEEKQQDNIPTDNTSSHKNKAASKMVRRKLK